MSINVTHIITGLHTGGAERSLFNVINSSPDHINHSVISLSERGHYGDLLKNIGISVYYLDARVGFGRWKAPFRLWQLVRRLKPDIIQGWMHHGNLVALLASLLRPGAAIGWNVRQSIDALPLEKRGTRWAITAQRLLAHIPDVIIYNSHRSREQHEALGYSSRRSRVIPNGFDIQRWRPDAARRSEWRDRIGRTPDDLLIGYVGRFHPMKAIPNFLEACCAAMNTCQNLHVAMVGEGLSEENAELIDAIDPDKRDRFSLLGRRPDVENILPAFDIFCLSSGHSEAFPNVLGEAMASGLPCIATDVGDSARVMGGHGLIVPPGDISKLVEAMVAMAEMDVACRAEIGKAARARVEACYSLEVTIDAYTELYDSMMKRDD